MEISEPVKHVPMQMKEAQVAPGQLITHYAPYCDTYLVQLKDCAELPEFVKSQIQHTVLLDFNNILRAYSPYCLKTINLSETYDIYCLKLIQSFTHFPKLLILL